MRVLGVKSEGGRTTGPILLLGAARSGTTWLAKVLDTHPDVVYLHEPLRRLKGTPSEAAFRTLIDTGMLDAEEVDLLWEGLGRTRFECFRPPFFPKSFLKTPPWALLAARRAAGFSQRGRQAFGDWLTPAARTAPNLLIKEVDWQGRVLNIVKGLNASRVIIMARHPCAVVYSRLRGMKMGVIPGHDRAAWLLHSTAQCEALGISERQVNQMPPWEFYALDWLLQNLYYRQVAQSHPRTTTVLYKDLCHQPERAAADVFGFLDWEVNATTSQFIQKSTHSKWRALAMRLWGGRRGYYNLYRDGTDSASDWKTAMPLEQQQGVLKIASRFPHMDWWEETTTDSKKAALLEGKAGPCQART